MLSEQKIQTTFIFSLLVVFSVLTFFIFKPYFFAILFALIIAVAVNPLYSKLLRWFKNREWLASLTMVLFVFIIVVVPLFFFALRIVEEAQSIYISLPENPQDMALVQTLQEKFPSLFDRLNISNNFDIYLQRFLEFLINQIGPIFSSLFVIIGDFFIMMFALYFILKYRTQLQQLARKLSPLPDTYDETMLEKLRISINSVVRGSLTIALIQGIVAGIGFTIFGVPAPMIWGAFTAVAALVPTIGTTLITGPAIIFLLVTGNVGAAIGLTIWAIVAVGLIDNFLGPMLIDRGLKLHPFIVLLSVLGGISFFGPLGFLLGPVTVAFLFTLIEIHSLMQKGRIKKES